MDNITIALPEIYVQNIEILKQKGLVPSRSEAIRIAVRDFMKKAQRANQLLGVKTL